MRIKPLMSLMGILFCALLFFSNSSNPPNARTGAPGDDGTCASGCHGGGSFQGTVDISGIPSTIQAGETYTVTLTTTATAGSPVTGGFQILALNSANQNVGDMIVINSAETGTNTMGGREYMEHRGDKNFSGGQVSWTFDWQAPNGPNDEDITLWFVSVLANNNGGNNGDNVITNTFTGTLTGAVDPLTISLDSKMDVSCFGGNDGSATVSTSGGTPPITITWSNGQTGPTATGLTAGGYGVTAMDANGQSAGIEVFIIQPPQLNLGILSETPITCASPATITVGADGGTPGYTYLWSTGTPGPTEILDNANTVSVSVTDANGCVTAIDVTPTLDIDVPVVSATGGLLTCVNQSVTLISTANSPCDAYTYSWIDPSGNIFSSDPAPIVASPGIYTVVVTDVCNGCTASAEAIVTEDVALPSINFQGNPDTISCIVPIVEIQVVEVPNATYSWSTNNGVIDYGANSATVGVSKGGTYTLILTDQNNGCSSNVSVDVEQIDPPIGTIDSLVDVSCFGGTNGFATLSATGLAPLVFMWPDSMFMSVRSDLSAGTYLVLVSDALGCADTLSVIVDQPAVLVNNMGATNESAQGANDGTAWVAPTGGIPGYTVLWNTGGTTDTLTGLAPGAYQATVTDANGCTRISSTTVQAFGCALTGMVSAFDVICFGDSTGSAVLSWMNEVGQVSIEWSTGDTTSMISELPAGKYIVTLTDEGNCSFMDSVTIQEGPELQITVDSIQHVSNPGGMDGAVFITVDGGPYEMIHWLLDSNVVAFTEDLTSAAAGIYTVELIDSNGCVFFLEGIELQEPSSFQLPSWTGQVKTYPVPVRDILNVVLPEQGEYMLRLMDSRGVIQFEVRSQTGSMAIPVHSLPEGAYWLLIQDDRGSWTVRPVVRQ